MTSPVVHFELAGPHEEPLRKFYAALLRWDVKPMGPGYALVATPDGSPDGAILEAQQAAVTLGVAVPDLAGAVAAAERLGATVVMPPTDNGYVHKAQVADPAGNVISLIEDTSLE